MLENYFVRHETVDRIRASWIGESIERYVAWLADNNYKPRSVCRRVPLLMRFGDFAAQRGAQTMDETPPHVDAFVNEFVAQRGRRCSDKRCREIAKEVRGPVEQMLRLVVTGFMGSGRPAFTLPFQHRAPGFWRYLREERGLSAETIRHYGHHLRRFEQYLAKIELVDFTALSPPILSAFLVESSAAGLMPTSLRDRCGTLRVFLRFLYRERLHSRDLSAAIESPQAYRLSHIPRSLSWDQVRQILAAVDRREPVGKRDYAILLLLVTYGLRAREVAALTLDHIDWRAERLRVPERKAGHSTAFPLSPVVGAALVDYIKNGRPETHARHVFIRVVAPPRPLGHAAISASAGRRIRNAGIDVPRAGSHTFRHTCVQRLVDADFSLKEIGDYIGHRSPASTQIYSKVAVDALREVAMGDGEEVV